VVETAPESPNQNAHCERWVRSVRQECLEHFVVLGEAHLRYILSSYVAHYNEQRPHQGIGNIPLKEPEGEPPSEGEIVCFERLGGLLKHYERRPAKAA